MYSSEVESLVHLYEDGAFPRRELIDRHPRHRKARRAGHRGEDLGRDREQARGKIVFFIPSCG